MNFSDRIFLHPWAILPTAVPQLMTMFEVMRTSLHAEEDEKEDWLAEYVHQRPKMKVEHGIATIALVGPMGRNLTRIEKRIGHTDYEDVMGELSQAMEDETVAGIELLVDTPGGSVVGAPETREMVRAAGAVKPLIAYIPTLGASAGYMIAAGANAIVASKSAIVGSIGTIATFSDWSQFYEKMGIRISILTSKESDLKSTWSPLAPMTEDQRIDAQRQLDEVNTDFLAWIRERRPDVAPSAMRGQWFDGATAMQQHLVDAVGSRESSRRALHSLIALRAA